MKKIIILFLSVLIYMGAIAQEETKKKEKERYSIETLFGMSKMVNYPTISMFNKNIASYTSSVVDLVIVRECTEDFSLELALQQSRVNIPHDGEFIVFEDFYYNSASFGVRLTHPLTDRLTAYQSLRFGVLFGRNNWETTLDPLESFEKRYGMNIGVFTGLKYSLRRGHYVNIGVGLPNLGILGSDHEGKATGVLDGFSIMIGYGL